MKKKSMHDVLTLLADVERAGLHKDRLSRIIGDTLSAIDEMCELSDEELGYVAAAKKDENMETRESLFRKKKK